MDYARGFSGLGAALRPFTDLHAVAPGCPMFQRVMGMAAMDGPLLNIRQSIEQ